VKEAAIDAQDAVLTYQQAAKVLQPGKGTLDAAIDCWASAPEVFPMVYDTSETALMPAVGQDELA
jgi:hypothetical protein